LISTDSENTARSYFIGQRILYFKTDALRFLWMSQFIHPSRSYSEPTGITPTFEFSGFEFAANSNDLQLSEFCFNEKNLR